jgi:tetratricopeptide (TPR) repeat protein
MPDVAKLKKKAAELELKKQFDKALAVYVEILDSYEGSHEEVDVALYNRVGDIHLKQGNVADAVDYYEKAVDHYVDTGFYNNAIALCNKILRSSPGRNSIYYKLGKISAHKGFKGDAKANFLEYADRMQTSGKLNEAFRALKEFADLCPDQDDIRLMLADQLHKAKRGEEAIEQLQLAYERYMQEGRQAEADAAVVRMKAIDKAVEPRAPGRAKWVTRPVWEESATPWPTIWPKFSRRRRAASPWDTCSGGARPRAWTVCSPPPWDRRPCAW